MKMEREMPAIRMMTMTALKTGPRRSLAPAPYISDMDGDGESDHTEYLTYQDPGVLVIIDTVLSPTNLDSQTITGTMETNATVAITLDTTASPGTVSYPTETTWRCTITGLAEGENVITATASDAQGGTGQTATAITLIPPHLSSPSIQ